MSSNPFDQPDRAIEYQVDIQNIPSKDLLKRDSDLARYVKQSAAFSGVNGLKFVANDILDRQLDNDENIPAEALNQLLAQFVDDILARDTLSVSNKFEIQHDMQDSYRYVVESLCAGGKIGELSSGRQSALAGIAKILEDFDIGLSAKELPPVPWVTEWFRHRQCSAFPNWPNDHTITRLLSDSDALDTPQFLVRSSKLVKGMANGSLKVGIRGLTELGHAIIARCQLSESADNVNRLFGQLRAVIDFAKSQEIISLDHKWTLHGFLSLSFAGFQSAVSRRGEPGRLPVATGAAIDKISDLLSSFEWHLNSVGIPRNPSVTNRLIRIANLRPSVELG